MIRKGMIVVVLVIALQGYCFGQGLLESIFGPGGLGLWGTDTSQISNPQYGVGGIPQQQGFPGQQQPYPAYPQGTVPGYPPYYGQPGVYSDWQNYPPATTGHPTQMHYPEPQQYTTQVQPAPAPPAPPTGPPQQPPAQRALRPGQQTPTTQPSGPPQVTAEDLPPGAVRITTTTPEGTVVQYYPPTGEPDQEMEVQRPRQTRPRPATAKPGATKQHQPKEQTIGQSAQSGTSAIAMPKPVEIPQGQDPRYGWGPAVNRAPAAPEVR